MGYCYYGNYAQFLEIGRVEALRNLGFRYKEMEEQGILLPVLDFQIKYLIPAKYDDLLTIETSIVSVKGTRILFDYRILNENDAVLITYSETGIASFVITFCGSYRYIPFSYCPIQTIGLNRIIENENGNFVQDEVSQYVNNLSSEQLDLMWNAYVDNNLLWKANQTSPFALSGTYYAK
jgi:acyl-CoA thioester hydrolase